MKLHRYVEQQRLHITAKGRHSYLSSSWVIRPWLIWKMFLTCSSFTIWNIWMKLHRYVDHQRLQIVTKDVISLSISVLLLFRHYISHKITFGAPSSGGVLCSACGAFISQGIEWTGPFFTRGKNDWGENWPLHLYTMWESDKNTRNNNTQKGQEVSPFPTGDHKALTAW